MSDDRDRIAIVGMAGRFPGARDLSEFWELLASGKEGIRFFDPDHLVTSGIPDSLVKNDAYVPANGYLDDVEHFDATFFGMSPREAEITDPQHRLFLQCAWHALEDAGHVPTTFGGRIGVYAGCGLSTYLLFNLFRNPSLSQSVNHLQFLMGNSGDYLPTRVSYKLNLKGPSVSVNTACSSSLVAVHMACQSLLEYESDVALAGGAGIQLPQIQGYLYQENAIQSPDGHCRAFDAKAAGTVSGNGLGVVVLRRLEEALEDGDDIRAVILGSAINNDGADKVGYTAPSVDGQASVITEALSVAGVEPDTIQYVETHGTGTPVGDPIEIEALTRSFDTGSVKHCAIGSVKTNVGHLDEAAGVAGLIKTVLSLEHGQIPPSLHFQSPNPEIDFERGPFYVNDRLSPWPDTPEKRRAGVSSFGIGGTNAHLVLEQAPTRRVAAEHSSIQIVPISAKSPEALDRAKTQLEDRLTANPELSVRSVAQTLQMGRSSFEFRSFVCGQTLDDLIDGLRTKEDAVTGNSLGHPMAFMFPGQGAQYAGMASILYESEPYFQQELDRCLEHCGVTGAMPAFMSPDFDNEALAQTELAQPAIFSVSYSLARFWMHRGAQPDFLIGHSLGEYVAACLAGVFSLEDAIRIVSERGRLMQSMPKGAMLAVALPQPKIESMAPEGIDLAAVNGQELCVVSGPVPAIDRLESELIEQGVVGRRLVTSHAFHSRDFDPVIQDFEAFVSGFTLSEPQIPVISNTTGRTLTADQASSPSYWSKHLRHPVMFAKGIEHLLDQKCGIFVEVGPGDSLTKLARRMIGNAVATHTLPHPREGISDLETMAEATGFLWAAGVDIDWGACHQTDGIQRISLPGYPFEPERHWVEPADMPESRAEKTVPTTPDLDSWFYEPGWYPDSKTSRIGKEIPKRCLVFHDNDDNWVHLRDALQTNGATVYDVQPGECFAASGTVSFQIRPNEPEDYQTLADRFGEEPPDCVIHLWALSESDNALDCGFHSLHALAQNLATKYTAKSGHWLFFSTASHEVTGDESVMSEATTLSGLSAVIPLEYPSLTCRHVDLDPDHADVVSQIIHEARTGTGPALSVWRDGERWLRTWKPIDLPEHTNGTPIRRGGTYLITGGTGSMGMAIAEHLADQTDCHLVLTGRSVLPDRQNWSTSNESSQPGIDRVRRILQRILAIESKGSTVEYICADVSDPCSTEQLCNSLKNLDGIIHAAGDLDPGLLARKSRKSIETVFAAKVGARPQLDALLEKFQPSFLVLCSSMSSISPIIGQGDYAAANAFLDAYAHEASRSHTTRVVSITWGFWQELGIIEKVRGDHQQKEEMESEIIRKGLQHAGIDAFHRILSNPTPPQVVVAPDGLERLASHPWLDRVVSVSEDLIYLEGTLSLAGTWVLDDHVILGEHILPGTAYLEMAKAAVAEIAGNIPVALRDVVFLQPLTAKQSQVIDVRAVVRRQETGWEFQILSRNGTTQEDAWIEHARGDIEEIEEIDVSPLDLDAIRYACRSESTSGKGRVAFESSLSEFGEHWQNLVTLDIGTGEALGEFKLNTKFEQDVDRFSLHPALLDNATGFLSIADGREALPFSYETIRIRGPLPCHILSHIMLRDLNDDGSASYDITITDSAGAVLIEIENYVLRRIAPEVRASEGLEACPANASLALRDPGSLSTLYLASETHRPPAQGEVEIEVKAIGLNFLEVLYSLGMLPYEGTDAFPYGLECAGIVRSAGADVTTCQPGDHVIAYANGCYRAFATVPETSVVTKPEPLTMSEAATLPAAYLTAWFGLVQAGRINEGERVLVHSAAGGVGLASVHVARMMGAEVLATAGTPEKRDFLKSLGIACVEDSRNPGFGAAVLEATAGNGVDVVLNSLGESFTEESLSALARYGRFVELGKRAILANGSIPLGHFAKQLTYTAVDVGPDMPGFRQHLQEIIGHVNSGALPPLDHRAFSASRPADGFEYMAQGKHIGKIVFTADSPSDILEITTERSERGRRFAEIVGKDSLLPEEDQAKSARKNAEQYIARTHVTTDTERKIAVIWHDLLGVSEIKRTDDFFDLNGDSLLAAQVISHVHRDLGVKLPISSIFDAPTIELLGRVVDASRAPEEPSEFSEEIEEGVI